MTAGTVLRKSYAEPPLRVEEILRYAGCRTGQVAPEICQALDGCLEEARGALRYGVCYLEQPVRVVDGLCDLGFATFSSKDLAVYLSDCRSCLLMGATVGLELDRLIARYGRVSPSRALLLQAIGSERVEALCDVFLADARIEYEKKGQSLKPRYSPGYGDLSLEAQIPLFAALDCQRQIGLSLNGSLLMSPTKSVTAIVGIRNIGE
ncbi:MAG: hypothetical protein IJX62_07030 [Clostridia bacterium]|nr:hypothetical protein [Clostridia bacterium]